MGQHFRFFPSYPLSDVHSGQLGYAALSLRFRFLGDPWCDRLSRPWYSLVSITGLRSLIQWRLCSVDSGHSRLLSLGMSTDFFSAIGCFIEELLDLVKALAEHGRIGF